VVFEISFFDRPSVRSPSYAQKSASFTVTSEKSCRVVFLIEKGSDPAYFILFGAAL
jgi:hypothetical protein